MLDGNHDFAPINEAFRWFRTNYKRLKAWLHTAQNMWVCKQKMWQHGEQGKWPEMERHWTTGNGKTLKDRKRKERKNDFPSNSADFSNHFHIFGGKLVLIELFSLLILRKQWLSNQHNGPRTLVSVPSLKKQFAKRDRHLSIIYTRLSRANRS